MYPRFLPAGVALVVASVVAGALDVRAADAAATAARPATTAGETRAAFLRVIDREKVPLAAETTLVAEKDGVAQFHFSFAADAGQRVPGYLLKPVSTGPGKRRPVVIALHGTGGNKDARDVRALLDAVVRAGCIGVAIDGRYHGERTKAGSGTAEYCDAIVRTWRTGREHPFFYDTAWDVMRLVDYLATRDDVDATRIGLTGFSKGGIETYFAAAADPRIAVAVPFIGVQSFRWALDNGQWKARIATIQDAFDVIAEEAGVKKPGADFVRKFYARVAPGIDSEFDGPAMLPLIAPRPLLVVNSDSDANTPIAGVRLAVAAARPAYAALHADDKLVLRVQENKGHTVTPESLDAAAQWFVRWLKP